MNYSEKLKELLAITIEQKASDLHISANHPPILRITGKLVPLIKRKKFLPEDTKGLAFALMKEDQQQRFMKEKEIDFSYSLGEKARFRVNIFFQKGKISCALRLIPVKILTIEELKVNFMSDLDPEAYLVEFEYGNEPGSSFLFIAR